MTIFIYRNGKAKRFSNPSAAVAYRIQQPPRDGENERITRVMQKLNGMFVEVEITPRELCEIYLRWSDDKEL